MEPGWTIRAAACRRPGTGAEAQISRARSPPYQPIRNASTRKLRAVVDTYSRNGVPGGTSAGSGYPSSWYRWAGRVIRQPGSPGPEIPGPARPAARRPAAVATARRGGRQHGRRGQRPPHPAPAASRLAGGAGCGPLGIGPASRAARVTPAGGNHEVVLLHRPVPLRRQHGAERRRRPVGLRPEHPRPGMDGARYRDRHRLRPGRVRPVAVGEPRRDAAGQAAQRPARCPCGARAGDRGAFGLLALVFLGAGLPAAVRRTVFPALGVVAAILITLRSAARRTVPGDVHRGDLPAGVRRRRAVVLAGRARQGEGNGTTAVGQRGHLPSPATASGPSADGAGPEDPERATTARSA